jgi:HEAT repeat protein
MRGLGTAPIDLDTLPLCAYPEYYRRLDSKYPRPWWWRLGRRVLLSFALHIVAAASMLASLLHYWLATRTSQSVLSLTAGALGGWPVWQFTTHHPLALAVLMVAFMLPVPFRVLLAADQRRETAAVARQNAGRRLARGYRAYLDHLTDDLAADTDPHVLALAHSGAAHSNRAADASVRFVPRQLRLLEVVERVDRSAGQAMHALVDDVSGALTHAGHRALVLLGPPGAGKTTLLRELAWQHAQAQREATAPGGRVLIHLNLASPDATNQDIRSVMAAAVAAAPGVDAEVATRIVQGILRGPSLVLVDGLDMLPTPAREHALAQLSMLRQRAHHLLLAGPAANPADNVAATSMEPGDTPAVQIIVIARATDYRAGGLDPDGFEPWELLPITDPAAQEQLITHGLGRRLALSSAIPDSATSTDALVTSALSPEQFLAELTGSPTRANWAGNPLLLTLAARCWARSGGTRLARTRAELYGAVTAARMEERLADWLPEMRQHVARLEAHVALELFRRGWFAISQETLEREIFRVLPAPLGERVAWQGRQFDPADILLRRSGLFIPETDGQYTICHPALLEYVTASALAQQLASAWPAVMAPHAFNAFAERAYAHARGLQTIPPAPHIDETDALALAWSRRTSARWTEVLALLAGILAADESAGAVGRPDLAIAWLWALVNQPDDVGLLGLRLAARGIAELTESDRTIAHLADLAGAVAEQVTTLWLAAMMAGRGIAQTALQEAAINMLRGEVGRNALGMVLVSRLSAPDWTIRRAAAEAIGALALAGTCPVSSLPGLLDSLLLSLGDSAPGVRRALAHALGALGTAGASALPALLALLDDPESDVRESAAAAIGALGVAGVPVLDELTARLTAAHPEQRQLAALAIVAIGALGVAGMPAVPDVAATLANADAGVRAQGAAALGALGCSGAPVLAHLAALLADPAWEVRRTAAEAIGRLGPAGGPALPKLRALLADEDPDVRRAAAGAIGALGAASAPALPALRARLTDPDVFVRQAAAKAIGALGVSGVVALPGLRALLADPTWEVRLTAAAAIGSLGAAGAPVLPDLRSLLASRHASLRELGRVLLAACGPIGAQVLPALLTDPTREVRQAALAMVAGLGAAGVPLLPDVQQLAHDSDALLRRGAAEALGGLSSGASVVADLCGLLADPDAGVRQAAAVAVGTLGPTGAQALPDLRAILADDDAGVRATAVQAIGALGQEGATALPDLRRLLADPDAGVRLAAAQAIRELGAAGAPALPDLLARLADLDLHVRRAAAATIGALQTFATLPPGHAPTSPSRATSALGAATAPLNASPSTGNTTMLPLTGLQHLLSDPDPDVRRVAGQVLAVIDAATPTLLPSNQAPSAASETAPTIVADGPARPSDPELSPVRSPPHAPSADSDGELAEAAALAGVPPHMPPAAHPTAWLVQRANWETQTSQDRERQDEQEIEQEIEQALTEMLERLSDADAAVRQEAALSIRALGSGGIRAVPDLLIALGDQEDAVSRAAANALVAVQVSLPPGLLSDLHDALLSGRARGIFLPFAQRRDLELYAALGGAAHPFLPHLAHLLDAEHWSVRQRAVQALGEIHLVPVSVRARLLRLRCTDRAPAVRQAASDVLETLLSLDPDLPEENL